MRVWLRLRLRCCMRILFSSMTLIAATNIVVFLLLTTSVAGWADFGRTVSIPATHPSLRHQDLPPIIPGRSFYASAVGSWSHQISPDGTKLAWIELLAGKPTLHVRFLDRGTTMAMEHSVAATRIEWAYDNRHLMFHRLVKGGRNRHLFVVDTRRLDRPRDLVPLENVSIGWTVGLFGKPGAVLVSMNLRNTHEFDLYEVNLETGRRKFRASNREQVSRWIVGRTGTIKGRFRYLANDEWQIEAPVGTTEWNTVLRGEVIDVLNLAQNLPHTSNMVYIQTSAGRDRASLVKLDLTNGHQNVVFEHPNVDVSNFSFDPARYEPLHVGYHDSLPRYFFFDQHLGADVREMLGADTQVFRLSSISQDRMRLILRSQTDRSGTATYFIDRRLKKKEKLALHPLEAYEDILSTTRPIQFNARDGLSIGGYLTIPHGTTGKRLPTVLKVHGGPWTRDYWGFDTDTQFLANRGYAVLEVNFRGSKGLGKSFLEKGRREFGRKMQDDLIDAVDWAVANGYTDPDKVAIFGRSYGGYATLVGLTRTPTKFAAGIDVTGPSDLALQVNSFGRLSGARREWIRFVGDPDDPHDYRELKERSPMTLAGRIERPLLIVHGGKDKRVSQEHSNRLVDRLREKGIPVEYLVFPDEGHDIRKKKNILKFTYRMEAFLAKYLGGRAGPTK